LQRNQNTRQSFEMSQYIVLDLTTGIKGMYSLGYRAEASDNPDADKRTRYHNKSQG